MISRLSVSYLIFCVSVVAICVTISLSARGTEMTCPGPRECRDVAPKGQLLLRKGTWTSPCGPNSLRGGHDLICEDIVRCPAAGGFGKFLQAVTENCREKTFDSYFGLDGLTFGILDWTSDNLPAAFEIYKRRFPQKFEDIFGGLHLPFKGVCLDPKWVCEKNRSGFLNCDKDFHSAFERSVRDRDLQKGQLEFALRQYAERIAKFQRLRLKTQYGRVSMAVVANNLRGGSQCKPETWMQQCKSRNSEAAIVDCMLEKYVEAGCRGSTENSNRRREAIERVFRDHKNDEYNPPDPSAIENCTSKWGQSSGVHP